MLSLKDVAAGYGPAKVLFGMSFNVGEGEAVALVGRNGMGKTTTIKVIMGLLENTGGEVLFEGRRIDFLPSHRVARQGIGLVPEGRQIFPTLTVEENLVATAASRPWSKRWTLGAVYALFPRLKERHRNLGGQLSGGEQQMLAIGRALMTNPKILILDEATEGLAPLMRLEIWDCLFGLKRAGQSILIVDKNVDALSTLTDRQVIVEKGRVVWTGTSGSLRDARDVKERYLHV